MIVACGETLPDVARTARHVAALTDAPVIGAWTKTDLRPSAGAPGNMAVSSPNPALPAELLAVSAESGAGLTALLAGAARVVEARYGSPDPELPMVTHARHRRALAAGREELAAFVGAWAGGMLPATVAAVHLHAAAHALAEVVGAVDIEDVLDRVFASFCVGK